MPSSPEILYRSCQIRLTEIFTKIKTKHFAKVAGALGLSKALIVAPEDNETLSRSARNIPGLTLTTPDRLSVLEVLKHKQLVLLEGAVESVQARFDGKKGA